VTPVPFTAAFTNGLAHSCIRAYILIITGSAYITSPHANSLRIAEKILVAWLVQINGGGHDVMFQYPQLASILETFFR